MKKIIFILCAAAAFASCSKSNKTIIRMQHLEEGVGSPTTIEELKDAIKKYEERVADIQLAQSQIGIWHKILATRYLDKKMYGEALKSFQKALEFYPQNQNLYYYVGLCAAYMSQAAMDFDGRGKSGERENYLALSEEAYLRAIKIEPRYARALYGLAVLYVFEMDECEKAIPHLETLLSVEAKNVDAMFVLARAYYVTLDFERAVATYDKIISTTTSKERKAEAEANRQVALNASYGQ